MTANNTFCIMALEAKHFPQM